MSEDCEARLDIPQARADAAGADAASARAAGRLAAPVLRYAALGLVAALMILPFADMFIGALRGPADVYANPPRYFPAEPQWGVYGRVFDELPMLRWLINSVVVTVTITVVQVLTSTLAGYALAKFEFPGRASLLRFIVCAQIFPFFLFIIPIFFILRFLPLTGGNDLLGQGGSGLLGTYAAMILPFAVTWYGIFLMRQFCLSIPDELLDAARIDGAGEGLIFRKIVVPLVRPAILTLTLFAFVYHWNEFIWTMTVTRSSPDLQTLPVGIYLLEGQFNDLDQKSLQQAALAVSVAPVLILFAFVQRFFTTAAAMAPDR